MKVDGEIMRLWWGVEEIAIKGRSESETLKCTTDTGMFFSSY